MNTGGILLLSGLLHIDEEDIIKTYKVNGFKKLETVHMDEWIAIAFIFSSEKL
jgi:ribosomal protein L11 methylase PrmA